MALAASLLVPSSSHAQTDPHDAPVDARTTEAREEFTRGADLVRSQKWAEALAAFEKSQRLHEHAVTAYNIAQCERALGRYTRARHAFDDAFRLDSPSGSQLPETLRTEVNGLRDEIDRLLVTLRVTVRPADATIAVDGRPVETVDRAASPPTTTAGTLPPGPGTAPPAPLFVLRLDPGSHVITLSRRGFADVVLNRTFSPSAKSDVTLELDRLPAEIHVASNQPGSIVRIDGVDVGNAPANVSRAAGAYHVRVTKPDFVPYDADVVVRPGERVDLNAMMRAETHSITQTWWFWTAAGVLLAGAALTTYFATRPAAQEVRPAADGGGLGWYLKVP